MGNANEKERERKSGEEKERERKRRRKKRKEKGGREGEREKNKVKGQFGRYWTFHFSKIVYRWPSSRARTTLLCFAELLLRRRSEARVGRRKRDTKGEEREKEEKKRTRGVVN